jgi:predicted O-methyltransferase YrrM
MNYEQVMSGLTSYNVVGGWPASIFLLPHEAMREIYDCIVQNKLVSGLELGSGHGATSCLMAAAMQETGGRIVTVDIARHEPANAFSLQEHLGGLGNLEVIIDGLGYNWVMADWIAAHAKIGGPLPMFDFCLLDGAHEWQPDALAVFLAVKLLRPGGWLVLDDVNFCLRSMEQWKTTHGRLSDRELDAYQIGMVYDLVVRQHPELTSFRLSQGGRIGWAQKALGTTAARPSRLGRAASALSRRLMGS